MRRVTCVAHHPNGAWRPKPAREAGDVVLTPRADPGTASWRFLCPYTNLCLISICVGLNKPFAYELINFISEGLVLMSNCPNSTEFPGHCPKCLFSFPNPILALYAVITHDSLIGFGLENLG